MPLFISGSNGVSGADGTAALPAVQGTDGNTGVFFPAADQVAIATGGVQRLLVDASGNVMTSVGSLYPLVQGTAVASTSGTAIDFTGIPSWVRRVTVMFNGVSTNGTALVQIQLGTSGGVETSGYNAGAAIQATASAFTGNVTTGFPTNVAANSNATSLRFGSYIFSALGSNTWVGQGNIHESTFYGVGAQCAGAKTLAGTLTQLRITTVGGTDTFDAGSINIQYE